MITSGIYQTKANGYLYVMDIKVIRGRVYGFVRWYENDRYKGTQEIRNVALSPYLFMISLKIKDLYVTFFKDDLIKSKLKGSNKNE